MLATDQETLPSPLPCAARGECCREKQLLGSSLLALCPLGHPLECPAEFGLCSGIALPFTHLFFPSDWCDW